MLIFDVGANHGAWSIANQLNNTIIAIEASHITYQHLCAETSAYSNIHPVNYAICTGDTEYVTFYQSAYDGLSTLDESWFTDPKSRFHNWNPYHPITVRRTTLDHMIEQYGKPDYIKLDVEGSEDIALQSLSTKVDLIAFEWTSEGRDVIYRAIDHLHNLGYQKYHVQDGDEYTYMPNEYPYDYDSVKEYMKNTKDKQDFGMIFAV